MGKQAPPARAAPSLAKALRNARGSLLFATWTSSQRCRNRGPFCTPIRGPFCTPIDSAGSVLRTVADGSRDPLIAFDAQYRVTLSNAAATRLIGRSERDVVGHLIWNVALGIHWAGPGTPGAQAACDIVPTGSGLRQETAGQTLRSLRWAVHPFLDEVGRVVGGFCIRHGSDVTTDADRQLRESERRFRDFVESASDWFWETDHELCYRYLSERYQDATGLSPEHRLGCRRGQFRLHGPEDGDWRAHLADLEARRPFRDFIFAYLDNRGARRVAKVSGRPVFDESGTFTGYRGVGCDITLEMEAEKRIRFLAQHDALTNLPNRALLKDRLEQVLATARRMQRSLAVLCVDLDEFKTVNDTLGHAAGDALLCETARRMRDATRDMDTVARVGGDEFIVVQAESRGWEDAKDLAQRLIARLDEPFELSGERARCGASIGISLYPSDGGNADELIRNADLALYRAKAAGRNNFCFYLLSMNEDVRKRRQIEDDLRVALERNVLQLYYQPLVDLRTGRVVALEALLRWPHPLRGMIPPSTFIGIAERSGLILKIDRWVLREACNQAQAWRQVGLGVERVAVNVSAQQMARTDLVEILENALGTSGLPAGCLEIEFTESVLLTDTETVSKSLAAVDALRISLSLDDFGTGYSSLIYLRRFPVSKVKIDRSFVSNMCTDADDAAIVRAILSLGHSLGLDVVAEGVETQEQFDHLCKAGCDKAQGYFIAKPMRSADCEAFLRQHRAGKAASRSAPSRPLALLGN